MTSNRLLSTSDKNDVTIENVIQAAIEEYDKLLTMDKVWKLRDGGQHSNVALVSTDGSMLKGIELE